MIAQHYTTIFRYHPNIKPNPRSPAAAPGAAARRATVRRPGGWLAGGRAGGREAHTRARRRARAGAAGARARRCGVGERTAAAAGAERGGRALRGGLVPAAHTLVCPSVAGHRLGVRPCVRRARADASARPPPLPTNHHLPPPPHPFLRCLSVPPRGRPPGRALVGRAAAAQRSAALAERGEARAQECDRSQQCRLRRAGCARCPARLAAQRSAPQPTALDSLNNVATVLFELRRYEEAELRHEALEEACRRDQRGGGRRGVQSGWVLRASYAPPARSRSLPQGAAR